MPVLPRLLDREPHRVDAAHLAGADPECLQIAPEHDRVRGDVLADAPGEEQVAPQGFARGTADDLHADTVLDVPVAVLDEEAAEHAPVVALAGGMAAPLPILEDPRRGLLLQRLERAL